MRIVCRHGHYAFYPRRSSDIQAFATSFDEDIVMERDYFTFKRLAGAKGYSLAGKSYIGMLPLASKTYAGMPWEVMKANDLVYNVALGILVPKTFIMGTAEITQKGLFYVTGVPLLQAGVRTAIGRQILSFSGEYETDKFFMRMTEFSYE